MSGDHLTSADKFHDYARRIENEVGKFQFGSSRRMDRSKNAKNWWFLQTQADKRLVLKIVRMVEEFEL